MRGTERLLLLTVILSPGCRLAELATHNLINEPVSTVNEKHMVKDLRSLARDAWAEHLAHCSDPQFSDDYESGFIDGYVDYLDNGGTGAPPAAPPTRYRRNRYLTPSGAQAVQDYFAGWSLGSHAAIASGTRPFLLVQISATPKGLPNYSSTVEPIPQRAPQLPVPEMSKPATPLPTMPKPSVAADSVTIRRNDPPKTSAVWIYPLPVAQPPAPVTTTAPTKSPNLPQGMLPSYDVPLPKVDPIDLPPRQSTPTSPRPSITIETLPREFTTPNMGGPAAR